MTDRHREIETVRDRLTYIHIDTETDSQIDRQTDRDGSREKER